jgi:hypothetical protein
MSALKARRVEKALTTKLGFERHDPHHRIYRLYLNGRLVARIFISHGQRELTDYHTDKAAKQMRLSRSEILNAVECPLDGEAYHDLIR